jgi:hypothetical protein
VVAHDNKLRDIAAAAAPIEEAGGNLAHLTPNPFPLREFRLKCGRVQYVAGSAAMVVRLHENFGS